MSHLREMSGQEAALSLALLEFDVGATDFVLAFLSSMSRWKMGSIWLDK